MEIIPSGSDRTSPLGRLPKSSQNRLLTTCEWLIQQKNDQNDTKRLKMARNSKKWNCNCDLWICNSCGWLRQGCLQCLRRWIQFRKLSLSYCTVVIFSIPIKSPLWSLEASPSSLVNMAKHIVTRKLRNQFFLTFTLLINVVHHKSNDKMTYLWAVDLVINSFFSYPFSPSHLFIFPFLLLFPSPFFPSTFFFDWRACIIAS